MSYIPADAAWYIAELLEEITVESDPRNVVHRNFVLIRADSPDEAYDKALALGRQSEISYQNPEGKQVHIAFRGLSELNVIHDDLKHGAEIFYEETIRVPKHEIEKWILPKDQLAVFRDIEPAQGPNYSCKEIMEDLHRAIKNSTRFGG